MIEICGICRVCERGGNTAHGLCFYCAQEATQALRGGDPKDAIIRDLRQDLQDAERDVADLEETRAELEERLAREPQTHTYHCPRCSGTSTFAPGVQLECQICDRRGTVEGDAR